MDLVKFGKDGAGYERVKDRLRFWLTTEKRSDRFVGPGVRDFATITSRHFQNYNYGILF